MPEPDRSQRRPPIYDRIESRRNPPREAAAIFRQNRREKLRILEEAAQKASGVNLREIRASLARNRKQTDQALAALRARPAMPPPTPAPPASRRFQSLKPFAGRLVPLAQPSLAFLDTPFKLDKYEIGGNWLWNSSITTGDVFFQANINATSALDFGIYTFRYAWNNDSDSAMLTTVDAGLSFTGWLLASAQDGDAEECWEAVVRASLDAELDIGVPSADSGDSRSTTITALTADNGFWGLGDGLAEQLYNNQDYSLSLDGFLVPPNSQLDINVSVAFSFSWGFDTPVSPAGNYVQVDFGEHLFPGNRVVSNGVIVLASPVVIQ